MDTVDMAASDKKKHHFVPQFLLRNFTDAAGQLEVWRLDESPPYRSTATDLAHRNHGHTLILPNRPPNPNLFEDWMGEIESAASDVVRRLTERPRDKLGAEDKDVLAWFLSLQWSRHRHLLGSVRREMESNNDGVSYDGGEKAATSAVLMANMFPLFSAWRIRQDLDSRPKDRWNSVVSDLHQLQWSVLRYKAPSLVVSDNIVCISGVAAGETHQAPRPAWLAHGVGIAFWNCARVTVPLTPNMGLLLTRESPRYKMKCTDFNQYTVFNSREFVAYSTGWPATRPVVHRRFLSDLTKQRRLRPAFGPQYR